MQTNVLQLAIKMFYIIYAKYRIRRIYVNYKVHIIIQRIHLLSISLHLKLIDKINQGLLRRNLITQNQAIHAHYTLGGTSGTSGVKRKKIFNEYKLKVILIKNNKKY